MKPHYFSLEEANAALQVIRPLMQKIQDIRATILANRPEVWPAMERAAGNGGNPALSQMVRDFERLDDLVHRVLATGAQIKDINSGLMDFLASRSGHDVYLCWKHGESEIQYWHEIEAGFAGRQPITTF